MFDLDTLRAWVKTHFVRKRDLANDTVHVGGLVLALRNYTVASGVITLRPGTGIAVVDTEGAAASDDLDTINGGITGQLLIVRQTNNNRDVVLKDGTGNFDIAGDFTLSNVEDAIVLMAIGTRWRELSRSDNR